MAAPERRDVLLSSPSPSLISSLCFPLSVSLLVVAIDTLVSIHKFVWQKGRTEAAGLHLGYKTKWSGGEVRQNWEEDVE